MFNTYTFNSTTFNSSGDAILSESLVDGISLNEVTVSLESANVYSSIEMDEVISVDQVLYIREALTIAESLTSSSNRSMSISDSLTISDETLISFAVTLSEDLQVAETLSEVLTAYRTLIDALTINEGLVSSGSLVAAASEIFTVASAILLNLAVESVEEALEVSETLVEIHNLGVALADILNVDDQPSNSVSIYAITAENLSVADAESLQVDYNVLVEDAAAFVISIKGGDYTYQGIVMHPHNFGITEYTNYSFNSSAHINDIYLLANENGLYRVEGTTDVGSFITAKIKTATLDFGTSNMKQVPKVYLGIDNDSNLILNVSVDGSSTSTYELALDTQNLTNQMFDIGKGLVGRYWQFELQTKENSELYLDEIEVFPISFGRKRR